MEHVNRGSLEDNFSLWISSVDVLVDEHDQMCSSGHARQH